MDAAWLLLIYSIPERRDTLASDQTLAARIHELYGQATLAHDARLPDAEAHALVARFQAARAEEYAEIAQAAQQLLEHMARETQHRDFGDRELEDLRQDVVR